MRRALALTLVVCCGRVLSAEAPEGIARVLAGGTAVVSNGTLANVAPPDRPIRASVK